MGKYDKFFASAKAAGIKEIELYIGESHGIDISIFHGEIDNYSDNNGMTIVARGIFENAKCGSASCDTWNKEKADYLIREIVNNAKVIENEDPVFIFKGSEKYHKVNTFNKDLEKVSIETKIAKLKELETAIKAEDPRVSEVGTSSYSESFQKTTILNSNGLNLVQKSNYFYYAAEVVATENGQSKSGFDLFFDSDFSKFDVKALAKKCAEEATSQLGCVSCPAKKYKAVLSQDSVNSLISVYISHTDAEQVQKKSSLFIGQVGKQIASKKLTVEDKPLAKNAFARWFDDEGVATYNKSIIKNGVLQTYLYNLTTAAKDGVTTTGNAQGAGSKKSTGPFFLSVKPGKKSLDELFAKVGNGVYITGVTGLHSGMNPQSGDFSLQASGFEIKDGKKGKPFDLITVSGNLLDVFKDIVDVGNDVKVSPSGISTPSISIKKLGVSGQ
ncbi:MAG: TldD/PmbA family protein [Bacilli bacterium]|nr:TldD/PmbA family protein [Bacilli bacterium]